MPRDDDHPSNDIDRAKLLAEMLATTEEVHMVILTHVEDFSLIDDEVYSAMDDGMGDGVTKKEEESEDKQIARQSYEHTVQRYESGELVYENSLESHPDEREWFEFRVLTERPTLDPPVLDLFAEFDMIVDNLTEARWWRAM